jgi:hypothetical protein
MIEYEHDDDGVISCRYRSEHPRDVGSNNWCALSKELCCYNANCLVRIPTNLSLICTAAEELVLANEAIMDMVLDHGLDCEGSYHDAVVTVQAAATKVKALLKDQGKRNGQE